MMKADPLIRHQAVTVATAGVAKFHHHHHRRHHHHLRRRLFWTQRETKANQTCNDKRYNSSHPQLRKQTKQTNKRCDEACNNKRWSNTLG
jgi:hypothetical protein